MLDEDYKKAGIRMLPSGMKDEKTAFQAMLYTIWLIPVSIMPFVFPYIGIESKLILTPYGALSILLMGVYLYKKSALLLKNCDHSSAKKLMFGSLVYLPVIQIIYLIDKYVLQ
jgi:protoheme IX farnesyltransferase